MLKDSNLNYVSNVYVLKGNFATDKEFHARVRGRKNLEEMCRILGQIPWAGRELLNEQVRPYLTPAQLKEWELGMYCACLGDREELVFGPVIQDGEEDFDCRCYRTDCQHFKICRPNYSPDNELMIVVPHDLKIQKKVEMTLPELPEPDVFIPVQRDPDSFSISDEIIIDPEPEPAIPFLPVLIDDNSPEV
ncbi:MAG: hypothetical protein GX295_01205, partial [Syntrophomonadaceae bacterium]|nr:hypothetical protein [Syntrophomonadaceae bacterium]